MKNIKPGEGKKKYHKDTFDRIPNEKRKKILDTAISEFAGKGYNRANINEISKKAGISIGSMYQYFASKEDLFFTVLDVGYEMIAGVLAEVVKIEGDIFDKLEFLYRAAQQYSKKYMELTQVYLDMTSEGLSHLTRKLSRKMESISAGFYQELINDAKKKNQIDKDTNENIAAFCLDNLIILLQFSYTADYYKERMKIFIGDDAFDDDEKIIQGMMKFTRRALS